jgi:hypothetical protein
MFLKNLRSFGRCHNKELFPPMAFSSATATTSDIIIITFEWN